MESTLNRHRFISPYLEQLRTHHTIEGSSSRVLITGRVSSRHCVRYIPKPRWDPAKRALKCYEGLLYHAEAEKRFAYAQYLFLDIGCGNQSPAGKRARDLHGERRELLPDHSVVHLSTEYWMYPL